MIDIRKLIRDAADCYEKGEPFISDAEYDALVAIHGEHKVGGEEGDIEHMFRMYSQQKHYDRDGDYPLNINECVKSPKLDGLAVSALYVSNGFVQGLTRGNGIKGNDIYSRLEKLVPGYVHADGVGFQITGEVVALKTIENSRNYASGAMNLKDDAEFQDRLENGALKFIAYNIQFLDGTYPFATYEEEMNFLESLGFTTVLSDFNFDMYPQDGTIYRISNTAKFYELGFTNKHPRGAFAHKQADEEYETTLLDVIWQTGKSGKVAPVAILEPVEIDGAIVSRATLNNIAYIEALELEIGCAVNVVRAGSIIPKIVGRAD